MANDDEQRGKWLQIVIYGLAVAFLLGGSWLAYHNYSVTEGSDDWGSPGTRGDFFGGHFAAVSGLIGVLLMFLAVRLQSIELIEQRIEMKRAREAAEKQAAATEQNTKELQKQNAMTRHRDDLHSLNTITQIAVDYRKTAVGDGKTGITYPFKKSATKVGGAGLRFIFVRAAADIEAGRELLYHFSATFPIAYNFPVERAIEYAWAAVEEPAKGALKKTDWEGLVRDCLNAAAGSPNL